MNNEIYRMSGRTTRQVNEIIELLFTNRDTWIIIEDHWIKDSNVRSIDTIKRINTELLKKIQRRLDIEHRLSDGMDYKVAFKEPRGAEVLNKELIENYHQPYLMIKLN